VEIAVVNNQSELVKEGDAWVATNATTSAAIDNVECHEAGASVAGPAAREEFDLIGRAFRDQNLRGRS
jgi:hypothetical protein